VDEAAETFYRVFYGDAALRMDRVYQLMSQQSHFSLDSWEWKQSSRKPLFGNSEGVFTPRQPERDQTLALPGLDAKDAAAWLKNNEPRLQLAADSLADNDELLGLLAENLRRVDRNRYNLEVYLAIARLYRQNVRMLLDIGRLCSLLERSDGEAVERLDQAIALGQQIRRERNIAYHDAVATYEKSWFPRVPEANGRQFLHDLDDVKDHTGDRTIDLTYMIQRELQLPFGEWMESIRTARNRIAEAHGVKPVTERFDWLEMGDGRVSGQKGDE
jgi:hexosaminidase